MTARRSSFLLDDLVDAYFPGDALDARGERMVTAILDRGLPAKVSAPDAPFIATL